VLQPRAVDGKVLQPRADNGEAVRPCTVNCKTAWTTARFYNLVPSTVRQCGLTARDDNLTQTMLRTYNLLSLTAEAYNGTARYYLAQAMVRPYDLLSPTLCVSAEVPRPCAVDAEVRDNVQLATRYRNMAWLVPRGVPGPGVVGAKVLQPHVVGHEVCREVPQPGVVGHTVPWPGAVWLRCAAGLRDWRRGDMVTRPKRTTA
jgi:hypothetical protein